MPPTGPGFSYAIIAQSPPLLALEQCFELGIGGGDKTWQVLEPLLLQLVIVVEVQLVIDDGEVFRLDLDQAILRYAVRTIPSVLRCIFFRISLEQIQMLLCTKFPKYATVS